MNKPNFAEEQFIGWVDQYRKWKVENKKDAGGSPVDLLHIAQESFKNGYDGGLLPIEAAFYAGAFAWGLHALRVAGVKNQVIENRADWLSEIMEVDASNFLEFIKVFMAAEEAQEKEVVQ